MAHADRPEFWDELYRQGAAGWDLGGPTPAFLELLKGPDAPSAGKMLVPGCGRGYDAVLFAQHGFDVTGVDYAPSAVEAARRLAEEKGVACTFRQDDLFALPAQYPGTFDYVLEYVCFCAISPQRRGEYVQAMADVLRPGGELIGLFFPVLASGYAPDGPPFPMSDQEIRALFSAHFDILRLAPTPHTIKPRRGRELFARLRRR